MDVEQAGPEIVGQAQAVVEILARAGPERVGVDGSVDRQADAGVAGAGTKVLPERRGQVADHPAGAVGTFVGEPLEGVETVLHGEVEGERQGTG